MKPILSLIVGFILIAGGMALYHFSPSQAGKRMVQASLDRFAKAIDSKDLKQVGTALGDLLTDDASIRLEVHFFSIGQGRPAMEQTFDKAAFMRFIDHTLYSVVDYSYTPTLQSFDTDSGSVTFTSGEWADGKSMMGGVSLDMRYSSNTECNGKAVIHEGIAKLQQATCKVQFRQVPKPGQEGKFMSKKNLNDLLGIPPTTQP